MFKQFQAYACAAVAGIALSACGGGGEAADEPDDQQQNTPPQAAFSATPNSGDAPHTVSFDAGQSFDAEGAISRYSWVLGDGQSATGEQLTHTYTSVGTFLITLTVTDSDGATDFAQTTVVVRDPADSNAPPTAAFNFDGPQFPETPVQFDFDASQSADDSGIVEYAWNFGDGQNQTTTTPIASHSYTSAGSFTVTLTVTDNQGASAQTSRALPPISAPPLSVQSITPQGSAVDVALMPTIQVQFTRAIDPASFNSANLSLIGPDGPVAGSASANGDSGSFTPSAPLESVSQYRFTVGLGIQDPEGQTLEGEGVATFFTAPDPTRWYQLSNLFRGTGEHLQLAANGRDCEMGPVSNNTDFWQFRPTGSDSHVIENLTAGDRLGVRGGDPDAAQPCALDVYGSIAHSPFSDQTWAPVSTEFSGDDPAFFRLHMVDQNGALDDALVVNEGNVSGQFWKFTPFPVSRALAFGSIGDSSGGNFYDIRCPDGGRAQSVDIADGDDIDSIQLNCDTGLSPVVGGTGGSHLGLLGCPEGSVLAGLRGSPKGAGGLVDQLGISCRWPFKPPQAFGDMRGIDNEGLAVAQAACPAPFELIGLDGRAGTLIDRARVLCGLPEATFAATDTVGGAGGDNPFALGCPPGTAAFGFRGRVDAQDVTQLKLVCVDDAGTETETATAGAGAGSDLGDDQLCAAGEVAVGLYARTHFRFGGTVIDQLGVDCSGPPNATFRNGRGNAPAGANDGNGSITSLTCPDGMFMSGVTGRSGDVIDSIQVHCSSL